MDEQKVNTLINLGQGKIVEKAYDDLASPPAKKVGIALSTILDIGNTVLWPVKWFNERTRLYFQANLKKYEEKLNEVAEEKVMTVPTEISMPILERFTYVSNEELSNAFVKLLTSASSVEMIGKAHPGFIYIIDRLSPDEARILNYLKDKNEIPRIDVAFYEDPSKSSFIHLAINMTGLEDKVQLDNSKNIDLYIDNLASLGLIKYVDYYVEDLENTYLDIKESIDDHIQKFRQQDVDDDHFSRQVRFTTSMYLITDYGRLFIDVCID